MTNTFIAVYHDEDGLKHDALPCDTLDDAVSLLQAHIAANPGILSAEVREYRPANSHPKTLAECDEEAELVGL